MHRTRSRPTPPRQRLLLAGLILLALVPAIAGSIRLGEIAGGAPVTPENARFLTVPLPVVLHIVGALLYSLLGAFQLVPALRRRNLRWHRFAGRYVLVPAGLVVALTGIWMTAAYEVPAIDRGALPAIRYAVGAAMAASLLLGVRAIGRRDFAGHGAWMIRAYALGMGAGTQAFTSIPYVLLVGEMGVAARTGTMAAGWLINIVVAEMVIARRRAAGDRRRTPVAAAA